VDVPEEQICSLLAKAMEAGRKVGRAEGLEEAAALCGPEMKLQLLILARASLDEPKATPVAPGLSCRHGTVGFCPKCMAEDATCQHGFLAEACPICPTEH